jgi:predicted nucleotidyltransferase
MAKKRPGPTRYVQPYRYASPNIPMSAIRRFARQIAERFRPEQIILFGSYAYGNPHADSDVDLLVIMPARNVIDQAIRIVNAMDRPFAHEIHVRTPYQMKVRLKEGDCDWFLREVVDKGKVLYESPHRGVGREGRGGRERRAARGRAGGAAPKHRVVSLPAGSGKVRQGSTPRTRPRRTANP